MSEKLEIPGLPVSSPPVFDEKSVRERLTNAKLINSTTPSNIPVIDSPNAVADPLTGVTAEILTPEADSKTSKYIKDVKFEGGTGDVEEPADKDNKHFKVLKTKLKEIETTLEAEKQSKAQIEAEKAKIVEEYTAKETKYQEDIRKAQEEAETNRKYREIYALEDSDEYKNTYVKPAADILGTLYQYANDYGASEGLIDDILNANNLADQNKLLASKFDNQAIMQLSPLIQKFRQVMTAQRSSRRNNRPICYSICLEESTLSTNNELLSHFE